MAWPATGVTAPVNTYRGVITNSYAPVTTSTVNLGAFRFTLPASGTACTVTLANTAGDLIESEVPLTPGVNFRSHGDFESCVGLQIKASANVSCTYVIQAH